MPFSQFFWQLLHILGKDQAWYTGKETRSNHSKWCSLWTHLCHLCNSLWSKPALFLWLKRKHMGILPAPRRLGLGRSRLRWDPGVWEHSVVTQATRGACSTEVSYPKPVWNWHQTKTGCVFPWAISEESVWRRSLRHLRKLQVKRHRDLPAKGLSDGSS